jgi:hypothetical protein
MSVPHAKEVPGTAVPAKGRDPARKVRVKVKNRAKAVPAMENVKAIAKEIVPARADARETVPVKADARETVPVKAVARETVPVKAVAREKVVPGTEVPGKWAVVKEVLKREVALDRIPEKSPSLSCPMAFAWAIGSFRMARFVVNS